MSAGEQGRLAVALAVEHGLEAAQRRPQLPRLGPERPRLGVDLGQNGDREQPARGEGGDQLGVPVRITEQLAHHHVVGPAAVRRQADVQVVGDPADPPGDPGGGGEPRVPPRPGRSPLPARAAVLDRRRA